MGRRSKQAKYRMFSPFRWNKFISQVPNNIHQQNNECETCKCKNINGKYGNEGKYNEAFNKCFNWMKCLSSEGCWVEWLVVNSMNSFEQPPCMQQTVCPVKICVMHNDHECNRNKKIQPAVIIHPCINSSVPIFVKAVDQCTGEGKAARLGLYQNWRCQERQSEK